GEELGDFLSVLLRHPFLSRGHAGEQEEGRQHGQHFHGYDPLRGKGMANRRKKDSTGATVFASAVAKCLPTGIRSTVRVRTDCVEEHGHGIKKTEILVEGDRGCRYIAS